LRGIEFQMTGAAKWKEREPKLVPTRWSRDKKVRVRGAKGTSQLIIMNEKKDMEECVWSLYVMVSNLKKKFCCEQVASEVAGEEARSGLRCQTGEQFW